MSRADLDLAILEKVIAGLRCCLDLAGPGGVESLNCEICPYGTDGGTCRSQADMFREALELLRGMRKAEVGRSEADAGHEQL